MLGASPGMLDAGTSVRGPRPDHRRRPTPCALGDFDEALRVRCLEAAGAPALYEHLSGAGSIAAVINDFNGRVLAHDALATVFSRVDVGRLRHQAHFQCTAFGGQNQISGRAWGRRTRA